MAGWLPMIVLHFTGRSSASVALCPHPLGHRDLPKKPKMKPPGPNCKRPGSNSDHPEGPRNRCQPSNSLWQEPFCAGNYPPPPPSAIPPPLQSPPHVMAGTGLTFRGGGLQGGRGGKGLWGSKGFLGGRFLRWFTAVWPLIVTTGRAWCTRCNNSLKRGHMEQHIRLLCWTR